MCPLPGDSSHGVVMSMGVVRVGIVLSWALLWARMSWWSLWAWVWCSCAPGLGPDCCGCRCGHGGCGWVVAPVGSSWQLGGWVIVVFVMVRSRGCGGVVVVVMAVHKVVIIVVMSWLFHCGHGCA